MGKTPFINPAERSCRTCSISKEIEEFERLNRSEDGLSWTHRHECKPCHRARQAVWRTRQRNDGVNCVCGERRDSDFKYCSQCRQEARDARLKRLPAISVHNRKFAQELKNAAFVAYGSVCACCDESEQRFLQIDHVGGWGHTHVDSRGIRYSGVGLYRWLKKHNYPPGFRPLCGSCHNAVSHFGYCPHPNWAARGLVR